MIKTIDDNNDAGAGDGGDDGDGDEPGQYVPSDQWAP